jgi:hypothetical protein
MALDRGSKIALTIGGIIGIGGFLYWLISKNKGSDLSGKILAVSKLSPNGTFAIYSYNNKYPNKEIATRTATKVAGGTNTPATSDMFPLRENYKAGQTLKISGNSSINGKYVISKVWYWNKDSSVIVALTLKNDGQWDGAMPKNSEELPNCKTACYYFTKPMDIPKYIVKATK